MTAGPERIYAPEVVREAVRVIAGDSWPGDEVQSLLDDVMFALRPLAEDGSPKGPWTRREIECAAESMNGPLRWKLVDACDAALAAALARHRTVDEGPPDLRALDPGDKEPDELAAVLRVLRGVLQYTVTDPVVSHRLERALGREGETPAGRYATVALSPSIGTRDGHGVEFHARVAVLAPHGEELRALAARLAALVEGHARFVAWSAEEVAERRRRVDRALELLQRSGAATADRQTST